MRLSDILFMDEYACDSNVSDLEISSVTSNFNLVNESTVFVFTRGVNHDKTKYLE